MNAIIMCHTWTVGHLHGLWCDLVSTALFLVSFFPLIITFQIELLNALNNALKN